MKKYTDYIIGQMKQLLAIDSPTGFTAKVAAYLLKEYTRLGYQP